MNNDVAEQSISVENQGYQLTASEKWFAATFFKLLMIITFLGCDHSNHDHVIRRLSNLPKKVNVWKYLLFQTWMDTWMFYDTWVNHLLSLADISNMEKLEASLGPLILCLY